MIGRLAKVTRHAETFFIGAVLALLITPIVMERRAAALRERITSVAEPARRDASMIQLSLALEVAALRGYVITAEPTMIREYRGARDAEQAAFRRLQQKAVQMGAAVEAAAKTASVSSERWNAASELVARQLLTREAFVQRVPGQQLLYRAALASTRELEEAIIEFETTTRRAIARSQRTEVIVLTFLTLLATASSGLFVNVAATLRTQSSLARTDGLTGLLNRRGFFEVAAQELQRALRHRYAVTLMYIDVDDFKAINDRQGHAKGDQLLKSISESLEETIRDTDTTARLGGDEFAVLVSESDAIASDYAALRIRSEVLSRLNARGWSVTLSVGAITVLPGQPNLPAVIAAADELMYAVKRDGKSNVRWRVFEPPAV